MSLLQFKVLSFDVVGTLIDGRRGMLDYVREIAPGAKLDEREFLSFYREVRASPLAMYFPDDLERVWPELAKRFGLPRQAAAGFRASVAYWPAFADTLGALKRLGRHFRLVAATNAQRWALGCFEHTLERPFDWTVTCDDAHHEKPDPRYFMVLKDMLAREGIRPSEILHVGQSQFHDIAVAQALGWHTCWIERYGGQQLHGTCWLVDKPVRPDWHFTTLRELADAVDAQATRERQSMALPLFAQAFA
jgi:putative hydrolase of the HAD superfamily